ncbi:hypothetical protein CEXT_595491 [Caerostris extrusa]|uniref:Uncharacterized protein n=1 Tax=Caerostris extrusa TaxID=172846 RepID=A0AAV4XZF6_CAEEX|nr:hypothetical protein CEXT_595491 [Caerostris extrusa]
MPLLSRYSSDGNCPGPPVARIPGLHQIKIFSLPRIDLSRNSICSLSIPFHPLLFGRHQMSRGKHFCAKGEAGRIIKTTNPHFLFFSFSFTYFFCCKRKKKKIWNTLFQKFHLLQRICRISYSPPTGFKTVWNVISLTSEINRSTRLECVTAEASWTRGRGLLILGDAPGLKCHLAEIRESRGKGGRGIMSQREKENIEHPISEISFAPPDFAEFLTAPKLDSRISGIKAH